MVNFPSLLPFGKIACRPGKAGYVKMYHDLGFSISRFLPTGQAQALIEFGNRWARYRKKFRHHSVFQSRGT